MERRAAQRRLKKGCYKIEDKYGRYHKKTMQCWAKDSNASAYRTGETWFYLGEMHENGKIENASIDLAFYFYELSAGAL